MTNLDKYQNARGRSSSLEAGQGTRATHSLTVYSSAAHSAGESELTESGLPMILCARSVEGELDDLMYGVISEDLKAMRIKPSYVEDVSGAAVLDPIIVPTLEDPFQSLVVKWMELDIPLASMNPVKNRDYVYLEAMGVATSQSGERLGYHLVHSVSFPQTQKLPNRVRGNISIVAFWRQSGKNVVEMYGTGILDPCGDMIRMLVVPGIASAFLSGVKYPYCGQMRKRSVMLEKSYRGLPTRR